MNKGYIITFIIIFFTLYIESTVAQTYYAVLNGGTWDNAATWSTVSCAGAGGSGVPGAGSDVVICNGITVDVSSSETCNNLTLSGGKLSWSGNKTIDVNGNLVADAGTNVIEILGGGTNPNRKLIVAGTCNIAAGATLSVGGTTWTQAGLTTVDGTLQFTVNASGNKIFNSSITISATGTFNNAIGENPTINGNITNGGSWIGCTGGTCTYTIGSVAGTYSISGNAVAMSFLTVGNAGTTINNNGALSLDGVGPNVLNGNGIFNNLATGILFFGCTGSNVNGVTFNALSAGNTVYYNFPGNQTIAVPSDGGYSNLVCSSSGTKTVAGSFSVGSSVIIQDAVIVNVGTNTLNGAGSLTMTGTSELQIAKCNPTNVPELTGDYFLTGGTITFNGACDQTWNSAPTGANTCNNLILTNSGAKCIGDITTINGDITISGSATMTCSGSITMDCSRTFTYSSIGTLTLTSDLSVGNFSQSAGTINDGGFNITICGSTWSRSGGTFNATGKVTFNGSTTVSGAAITTFNNVTINPSKTLIGHSTNMNCTGADFINNGTFTHNNSTVTFTTASVKTISGSSQTTFNNLTISAGTLSGHSTNINIEGNWTNNSIFAHNNGKVTFTGGNAQSLAGTAATTFYDLEINKSVGSILSQTVATTSVNNLLTMTEGVYNAGINTLNGTGGITATGGDLRIAKLASVPELTGTYSVSGGTVTLNGAGAQTLNTTPTGADTYFNLIFSTSGAKTITNLLTINGDVTVSGTATLTSFSAFTQASSKTFNYNSTGATTVTAGVGIIIGSYSQTAGTFTLPANAGNTLTVKGSSWSKTAGTFTTTTPSRVIFNGSSLQTFSHNTGNFANVTINNINGLQLNSNISIATNLTFTLGCIVTGSNSVILTLNATSVTNASQATGYVDGNMQRYISTSPKTFYIGSGGNYSPIDFTFVGITAGNLVCSTTPGDHYDIFASDVDPNKTVNRYWTINFTTLAVTSFGATFNYSPAEVDAVADPSAFGAQRYDAIAWSNLTISGTPTSTTTTITGTTPTTSQDYIIGERFNPNGLFNAVTGAMNWNNSANWIRYRTGTISYTLGNPVITGTGTAFTTEISPGDIILNQSNPSASIGTVLSVDNDAQITLTGGASATSVNASFGIHALPGVNDEVNIGNPYIAGAAVNVNLDVSGITIYRLLFTRMAFSNSLTHVGGNGINITGNVNVKQPTSANTNSWNINAGSAALGGNLTIGSNDGTAGYVSRINLTTGALSVGTNLVFYSPLAANAVLDLSGGASTVNLSGNFTLTNTGSTFGTFTPGASSTFNYNKTTAGQTVTLTTLAPAVTYCNLHLNNTSVAGATISVSITAARVTGNMRIQSGKFTFAAALTITGNAAKTFEVVNGATFEMTGSTNFPTGFGTFTFGETSYTQYHQNLARTVSPRTYGNLQVQPTGNVTHTFPVGTTIVQGNLDLGNGINTVIVNTTATAAAINVTGDILIYPNTTFDISNSIATPSVTLGGTWNNNGGTFTPGVKSVTFNGTADEEITGTAVSQTFYNINISKTAGTVLSVGGSTTVLNTNNITLNTGDFTAPPTLNLNGSATATITLGGGTFTAGSLITINGHWTNNGGTFVPNNGLVQFVQGTSPQNINGTAVSQSFYDVEINKSAGVVTIGGSTTTLTVNNFTQTAFNTNISAATTFNVDGNYTVTSGTFTPCNNINIKGDISVNGGTAAWGTNVNLIGTTEQSVGGSAGIPNFTNLTINNSFPATAITLGAPITVNGILTLTDGHITTDATNILTLGPGISVVLNAPVTQDSSFVIGPISCIKNTTASQTFVLPIGKDKEMHQVNLTLTHSAVTSTTYTAEFINTSASVLGWTLPGTLTKVSNIGHWEITKGAGSNVAAASVKLYYRNSDEVTDHDYLRVAKGDPTSWVDIGGTGGDGFGNPLGYIISTVNFTTFSKFALANAVGGTNVLPIELIDFSAEYSNRVVVLKWITSSEINNDYFTIERSQDAVYFSAIGTVDGAGNSNRLLNYSAIDKEPFDGISYYRLRQTDYDGKSSLSNIVSINIVKPFNTLSFDLFPNPVNKDENPSIKISSFEPKAEVLVVVLNLLGQELYSKVVITDFSGNTVTAIDIENRLPAGTYLIIGTSMNQTYNKYLIIQ